MSFSLHVLSALFNNLKNIDSQDVTTQMDDFNVDCALKLCNYTSLKRFIRLNKILKSSPIQHSQFYYYTLPFTPFKAGSKGFQNMHQIVLICITRRMGVNVIPTRPYVNWNRVNLEIRPWLVASKLFCTERFQEHRNRVHQCRVT